MWSGDMAYLVRHLGVSSVAWLPSLDPHDGRREDSLTSCLISTGVPCMHVSIPEMCVHHTGTHLKERTDLCTDLLTCFYDRNRPFLAFRNKHIPIWEQNTAIVHLVFSRFFILGQILCGWTLHPWARLKRGPPDKLSAHSVNSTMTNFFSLFL